MANEQPTKIPKPRKPIPPEVRAQLGKLSDAELSRQSGVSEHLIGKARKAAGIAPYAGLPAPPTLADDIQAVVVALAEYAPLSSAQAIRACGGGPRWAAVDGLLKGIMPPGALAKLTRALRTGRAATPKAFERLEQARARLEELRAAKVAA